MSRNRAMKAQRHMLYTENVIQFDQARKPRGRMVDLVPRTQNQERLILALEDADQHIVITVGPAGTGKTYIGVLAAVKAFKEGTVDRIVLTRPAVGVEDEEHGFLPGDLNQKMEPWIRPITDILREYYRPQDIATMIKDQKIEIAPLSFMRGRSFKNCFLIAEEMQNATPNQVKMLLTRIGEGSKIVLTGDIDQADRKGSDNGLADLCQKLTSHKVKGISLCEFDSKDIQRHHLIGDILKLYK